mmetsp:Transcript_32447/g.79000  ORF Transcript_32447/g.79000 Transcript_32447/m.79000 type:complete len:223 (-) Transcript_32447:359-1027(-)
MPITQPPPFLFMQNTLCTLRAQRPKSEGLLVPSAAERDVPPTQQDEHPHRRHNFLRTRKKMNPMRYAPVVHFLWRHAVAPPAAARCPRHARPLVAARRRRPPPARRASPRLVLRLRAVAIALRESATGVLDERGDQGEELGSHVLGHVEDTPRLVDAGGAVDEGIVARLVDIVRESLQAVGGDEREVGGLSSLAPRTLPTQSASTFVDAASMPSLTLASLAI